MRIAMVVNNLSVSGGYQKLVLRLSDQLIMRGHELMIFTYHANYAECYPQDIATLPIKSLSVQESAITTKSHSQLAALINGNWDALVVHDELSIPVLARCHLNRDCVVCWMLNNQLSDSFGVSVWKIFKDHCSDGTVPTRLARFITRLSESVSVRQGLARVDLCMTYDEYNSRLVAEKLRKKTMVVYAGADLERFGKVVPTGKSSVRAGLNLLSVGVVFPHRRYEDLVRAVRILKDRGLQVALSIVGLTRFAPQYARQLQEMCQKLSVSYDIKFIEHVTDEEMLLLYQGADIFLFVNDGSTWGISVFEAMAAGLPVIISENIGAADLIENGQHAWVVSPRQPEMIAEACLEILGQPERAAEIVRRAREEILPRVTWSAFAERIVEAICHCGLAGGGSRIMEKH